MTKKSHDFECLVIDTVSCYDNIKTLKLFGLRVFRYLFFLLIHGEFIHVP